MSDGASDKVGSTGVRDITLPYPRKHPGKMNRTVLVTRRPHLQYLLIEFSTENLQLNFVLQSFQAFQDGVEEDGNDRVGGTIFDRFASQPCL